MCCCFVVLLCVCCCEVLLLCSPLPCILCINCAEKVPTTDMTKKERKLTKERKKERKKGRECCLVRENETRHGMTGEGQGRPQKVTLQRARKLFETS